MAAGKLSPVVRFIHQIAAAGLQPDLPDDQLLGRFVRQRDERAFAALVRRHGPLVMGICRRVLCDWHAAEDAFQATFLVLAAKAGSLARPGSLGPWLHGVATRTALKARARAAQRRSRERQAAVPDEVEYPDDLAWRDLRPVLDQAVARLPEKYRVPVVLCYLEGRTVAEAARELGWPPGTFASRLLRGRERLSRTLTGRGVTLGVAVLGTMLTRGVAVTAGVPAPLLAIAAAAATAAAAEQVATGGLIAAETVAIAKGVLHAMSMTRLTLVVSSLPVVAAIGVAAGGVAYQAQASQRPPEPPGPLSPPVRRAAPAPAVPIPGPREPALAGFTFGVVAGHLQEYIHEEGGRIARLDFDKRKGAVTFKLPDGRPVTLGAAANRVQLRTPTLRAWADRMGAWGAFPGLHGTLILEGHVRLAHEAHGQRTNVRGDRVVLHLLTDRVEIDLGPGQGDKKLLPIPEPGEVIPGSQPAVPAPQPASSMPGSGNPPLPPPPPGGSRGSNSQ